MPTLRKNLATRRFGRLLVIAPIAQTATKKWKWVCVCDCGTVCMVIGVSLTYKKSLTQSCGCLHNEIMGNIARTHGKYRTAVYRSYRSIVARCTNPKELAYKDYGARGITCEFASFEEFYAEMGDSPGPEYSIDRINNDGSYAKGNMRWATQMEQANNTRWNHPVTFNGVTQTLAMWARKINMKPSTLQRRLGLGWTDARALTTPVRSQNLQ